MPQTWLLQLPTFRFLWTLLSVNYYSVGVNLGFMLSWCINEIVTRCYGIFMAFFKWAWSITSCVWWSLEEFFSFLFWYRRKDLWANSKNTCNLRNGQRRLAAWLLNLIEEWVEFHILREMIHVILLKKVSSLAINTEMRWPKLSWLTRSQNFYSMSCCGRENLASNLWICRPQKLHLVLIFLE